MAYTDAAAQGATWNDEQATVVVVDNGTGQPAVFFTSIPDTATLNAANVTTLVSSLQLATPAAGQTDTATATPTDGSQGGGGNGGNGDGGGGGSNP